MPIEWETVGISILSSIAAVILTGAISLYITKSQIRTQFELQKKDIQHEFNKFKEEKILDKKIEKSEEIMNTLSELHDYMLYKAPPLMKLKRLLTKKEINNIIEKTDIPEMNGSELRSLLNQLFEGFDFDSFAVQWRMNSDSALHTLGDKIQVAGLKSLEFYDEKRRRMVGALIYFSAEEAKEIRNYISQFDKIIDSFEQYPQLTMTDKIKLSGEMSAIINELENLFRRILITTPKQY